MIGNRSFSSSLDILGHEDSAGVCAATTTLGITERQQLPHRSRTVKITATLPELCHSVTLDVTGAFQLSGLYSAWER
jgi:hypothetical protein